MSPIVAPKALVSEIIAKGGTIIGAKVRIYFTGTIKFEMTANATAATPSWEELSLTTGALYEHEFITTGSDLRYRIIGSDGAVISSQQDSESELWTAPGIAIEIIYEEE